MDRPLSRPELRLWLLLLGRGLVGALVGLLLIANPWASERVVSSLFAGYAVADGALGVAASRHFEDKHGRGLLFAGVVDGLAAVLAVIFPAAVSLRVIGGMRGILAGGADFGWSRRVLSTELFALGGAAAAVTGMLVLAWPGPATTAMGWLLGIATLVPSGLFVAGAMSEFRRVLVAAEPNAT